MYRVKAPKNGAWVPLLANPDIVLEYNQNVVTTLHAKNLLFLGEDRFLSTLMLRTFPKRQMMFLPQAVSTALRFELMIAQFDISLLFFFLLKKELSLIFCFGLRFAKRWYLIRFMSCYLKDGAGSILPFII